MSDNWLLDAAIGYAFAERFSDNGKAASEAVNGWFDLMDQIEKTKAMAAERDQRDRSEDFQRFYNLKERRDEEKRRAREMSANKAEARESIAPAPRVADSAL